jgi:hypothetical protein
VIERNRNSAAIEELSFGLYCPNIQKLIRWVAVGGAAPFNAGGYTTAAVDIQVKKRELSLP